MSKRSAVPTFSALLFRVPGPGGWVFAPVPRELAPPPSEPWGRAPVTATVLGTTWDTSVWHDRRHGPLLALPKKVRGSKGDGDEVEIRLAPRRAVSGTRATGAPEAGGSRPRARRPAGSSR